LESPQSVGPESADTNPVDLFAHSSEPASLCENAGEFESSFDLAMLASDEDSDCEVEKDIEEQSLSELDEIESMVNPHENLDLYEEVEGACLIEDGQFEGLHVAADDNIQLEDEYFQPLYEGHWKDIQYIHNPASITNSSIISSTTMLQNNADFFSCKEHLGVIINTDGVPLFKSSRTTLWPVYLEIGNYPPTVRFRKENAVICGFWIGQSKPDMQVLLKRILKAIDNLNILGFSFDSPDGVKTIRIKLLFGVFDLIAKAKALCMNQFNGHCGCPTCLHPGEHKGSHVYTPGLTYPIRTEEGIEYAVAKGVSENKTIEGVKGTSPLHSYVHLVNGVPPDYMHCVLKGVTKALLKLWTNPSNRSKPFSIRIELKNVDKTLCKQKPPYEFTRSPRSITGDMNYWKASEFRTWLLFYSLPLLLHILPPLYFHHFALLVCAMHILLSKQITDMACGAAEEMLLDFYNLLPELYGVHSCTMNAHSLTHLCYYVRLWKRAVNSNRQVADQLSCHIDVQIMLQKLYSEIEKKESESCLNFLEFNRHSSTMTKLTYVYAIGASKFVL
uniref:Transposase domain-containing protein n=1 Tax=Amphimedon queenslandica TaxID=400682 RepID=A0A1X7TKI8_AMPQE